jgi:hypothetical protein
MVILTPIETLQVFFKGKPAHIVALICRQETVVANMAFSKREQSFCVLEYARTLSVVTVLAANQGNYVRRLFLKKTWRVSLSIGIRITMIRYVLYLLQIF